MISLSGKTVSEVINTLESDQTVFVKSGELLNGRAKLPTLSRLRTEVANYQLSYVIDFTDTKKDSKDAAKIKKMVLAKFGVYFECDWLLANKYNGRLLFTPIKAAIKVFAAKSRNTIAFYFQSLILFTVMIIHG